MSKSTESCDIFYSNEKGHDFINVFPPELSNQLLSYVQDRDLFACCQCSSRWREVINNDQQWLHRCLRRGWTTKVTMNEAHAWKGLSHSQRNSTSITHSNPQFIEVIHHSSSDEYRLSPLCDWALYFHQRLHLQRNWAQGIYTVDRLVEPEPEESLVINCSASNGKYFAYGTTFGVVAIWRISGIPKFCMSTQPIQRNIEVEKVLFTSTRLVVLYEEGVIRVLQESEKLIKSQNPFQITYQTIVSFKLADNFDLNVFQLETVSTHDLKTYFHEYATKDEDDIILFNEIYTSQRESKRNSDHNAFSNSVLIYATEYNIYFTVTSAACFIVWNLCSGQDPITHFLPANFQVFQMLVSPVSCIISIQQSHQSETRKLTRKFGIIVYDSLHSGSTTELSFSKVIDEIYEDTPTRRIAFSSEEGLVAAYSLLKKKLIFVTETTCIDNLTGCEDLIFYHECVTHAITALSWTGEPLYQITDRLISPVTRLACFGPYFISGGPMRELIVWDKASGNKLHTVHRQPGYISEFFVSASSIMTVGRDDFPVMISYL